MHDQVAVRFGDCTANAGEQAHACTHVEHARSRVLRDRHAVDVFHDQVRDAGLGHAAVDQACDVRVLQRREHAAFALEQALFEFRIQAAAQQLDRGLLAEIRVLALPKENRRHAALSERAHEAERTDAAADQAFRRKLSRGQARGVLVRGSVEETVAVVRGEQIAQALAQARIGNVCMDPARTRLRRLFEQRIESLAQGILGGGIGRRCHCCG